MKTGIPLPRALCLLGAVLLGPLLLASCELLHSPGDMTFAEGEHVVIYYHRDTPSPERFATLAREADKAWLEVLAMTGLHSEAAPRIFVLEADTSPIDTGLSEYFMIDNTVHLSTQLFSYPPENRAAMLRHELTHLAVYTYYGLSESFILVEGIAEYAEYAGDYPHTVEPGDRQAIVGALPLSLGEVIQGGAALPDSLKVRSLGFFYQLAGSFAAYIIDTYSVEEYLRLYRNFDRTQPEDSYHSITGHTLEEMYDGFSQSE